MRKYLRRWFIMNKIKKILKDNKQILGSIVLCGVGITLGSVISKQSIRQSLDGYVVKVELPEGYEIVKIAEDIK